MTVSKGERKRRNRMLRENRLEEFRLALLALSDEDLISHLTSWIDNHDLDGFETNDALLDNISAMLRVNIQSSEDRRIFSFDHRLRERIADLSMRDMDILTNLAFGTEDLLASIEGKIGPSGIEDIIKALRSTQGDTQQ